MRRVPRVHYRLPLQISFFHPNKAKPSRRMQRMRPLSQSLFSIRVVTIKNGKTIIRQRTQKRGTVRSLSTNHCGSSNRKEIRRLAQDGGVVTALLVHGLKTGYISAVPSFLASTRPGPYTQFQRLHQAPQKSWPAQEPGTPIPRIFSH